jgi:hypothetical protein
MSLEWLIAGTIGQLMLGMFLFMLTIFGGAGAADHASRAGKQLSLLQSLVIDWSIYTLPALCFISAGIVVYLYKNGGGALSYYWYLPPIVVAILYWLIISKIYA